ncbi:TonB-dependent receptor [Aureimonas fodinaquatilis]|uniref:TonB-dependent receptor n=1 Tax=Aureimonas fodinaquatilis TaxID=2565783 RepID=A0A5B0DTM7_9HYPH|nr:TonB-dependent receptor [Aureimonas fodinaquatilis]KAA0969332.1 TonB-dependent receptor [Aureimonas fodinaquatilis]
MSYRQSKSILLACTAVLTLSQASAVLAQTATTAAEGASQGAQAPAANSVYLSTVTVQSAQGVDPYLVPGATSVITADEIEQFGGKNIDDVLRATPGVFTRDNVQNPGVAVNIRGLEGSGRVNMMIDGVRQNFRFTGHEAQGLVYVDPAFLAGVDVNRGYVSGVGGGNALAGSVNFRTWDVDDLIKDGKNYGGFLSATYGTNKAGWSESAVGAYRFNETFGFLGGISKRDPGNYDNGNGQTVPFTESDEIAGLLKFEFTPNAEHSLKFGANLLNDDFLANSYYQTIKSRIFNLGYSWDPTDNDLIEFRANAYRTQLNMDYDYSPQFATGGAAAGREIENTGTGFDISNTSRFELGGVAVRANYGVEYFSDNYDVVNSATVPGAGVNGSGENSNYSIFSSTTLSYGIADLILGLRYDGYTLEGDGAVTASNPLGMPAGPYSVDRSGGRVNPSVTLALRPVDWFQPYVTYAQTSRPPTISETFVGGSHPGSSARMSFFPNPFLKPEISKGWEVGANIVFDALIVPEDSFRLKANYFNNQIQDYIVASFVGGTHFANVPGSSTVQGVEIQAAYDTGRFFGSLAYTHTDSELPSQANGFGAQSYVPDDVFTATIGARFFEERLTVGARAYAVSRSYVGEVNVPSGVSPYEPGYELVDLFGNYKFDNGIELSGNITNLFDEAYTPALSTPPGGSDIETGRGRTFFMTAKFNF